MINEKYKISKIIDSCLKKKYFFIHTDQTFFSNANL